jgi:hypothetical protein
MTLPESPFNNDAASTVIQRPYNKPLVYHFQKSELTRSRYSSSPVGSARSRSRDSNSADDTDSDRIKFKKRKRSTDVQTSDNEIGSAASDKGSIQEDNDRRDEAISVYPTPPSGSGVPEANPFLQFKKPRLANKYGQARSNLNVGSGRQSYSEEIHRSSEPTTPQRRGTRQAVKAEDSGKPMRQSPRKRGKNERSRHSNQSAKKEEVAFINPFEQYASENVTQQPELDEYISSFLESSKETTIQSEDWSITTCPNCGEEVNLALAKSFLKNRSAQAPSTTLAFCGLHRRQTAEEEWIDKGYPVIKWKRLPRRFKKFYPDLEEILSTRKSVYRDKLVEQLSSKRAASKRRLGHGNLDEFTPGYYGGKGADIMIEAISEQLSQEINIATKQDEVITNCAGGVGGYLQAVLVPELAWRLVMEDMECSPDEAKRILSDSVSIGDILSSGND